MDQKTGPDAERVNNSMKVLFEMTNNTYMAKYAQEQLDKVNEARGLKPKDPGYLKPADFAPQDAEGVRDPAPGLQQDEFQKNFAEKLKKFSFVNADDQSEAGDESFDAGDEDLTGNEKAKKQGRVYTFDKKKEIVEEDADEDQKNSIGNLTLLDERTNKSYGNSLFCQKNRIIRERITRGTFVPASTSMVFNKDFDTSTNRNFFKWGADDKRGELIASSCFLLYNHREQ